MNVICWTLRLFPQLTKISTASPFFVSEPVCAWPGNNLQQSLESDEVQRYLDVVLEATYKSRRVALREPEIMRQNVRKNVFVGSSFYASSVVRADEEQFRLTGIGIPARAR